MAEGIVEMACARLRSAIASGDEATHDMAGLMDELEDIQPMLESAEMRLIGAKDDGLRYVEGTEIGAAPQELSVRQWLIWLTKTAYGICDMMDEFQGNETSPATGMMRMKLPGLTSVPKKKNPISGKIKMMENEARKLHAELSRFNLKASEPSRVERILDVLPRVEKATFVGMRKRIQEVMYDISSRDTSREDPIIIPIAGKGGSGKTALARMVFSDSRFRHYSRVWIHHGRGSFGRGPDRLKIYRSIVSQLSGRREEEMVMKHAGDSSSNSSNGVIEYMKKRLQQLLSTGSTQVLVVLDDRLWRRDDEDELMDIFAVLATYSKVIVIVTKHYDPSWHFPARHHTYRALNADECWTIIKQQSGLEGRSDSEYMKQRLEQIGRDIASKCGGQPLAAQVLGSVLRHRDARGWEDAARIYSSQISSTRVPPFLMLAYASMSPTLRLCFSYCAIFPWGYAMAKDDLIHEWIALGLLEPSEGLSASQQGEQHINMLLAMTLLHATKPPSASGKSCKGVTLFTMHEEVRELGIVIIDDKLCVLDGAIEGYHPECLSGNKDCRYALIIDAQKKKLSSSFLPAQLRALRCLRCDNMEVSDDSFSSVKCLRVLELKEHAMRKLPVSVCQLTHLRYLNLSGCFRLVTLPESIGDLLNLMHLNLSRCSGLANLPASFGKLISLLHIRLSGCSGLKILPESFVNLMSLVHIDMSGCSSLEKLPELFWKLTNLGHMDASGCSVLVNLAESFGKLMNLVHLDLSGCSSLQKLPKSFGKLIKFVKIELSGCSGLEKLPESFGDLVNLERIDLSGCCGLEKLPRSFGKLVKLVHLDLSGCSRLGALPDSFGSLVHLMHINLSCCHGLMNLPRSFNDLEKLVYLDLSFWSCFEVILTALRGSHANLKHLNLSHPCCDSFVPQDRPHLERLKEVICKLTKLQYLNLSMFLDLIFYQQQEPENSDFIWECISVLTDLENLDLSHNVFLRNIPESLGELKKLHTLNLSGCFRIKSISRKIYELNTLKELDLNNCRGLEDCQFVVHGADSGGYSSSSLVQLEDVLDVEELEIRCLENAKSKEEARRIRLLEKQKLRRLKLCWTPGSRVSTDENALLGELQPPQNLQHLELQGYSGVLCSPKWLLWLSISRDFHNLVEITMEDIPRCIRLPTIAVLPNLQQLVLRGMASITTIDARDLIGGSKAAFTKLSKLTLDDMSSLEAFKTRYNGRAAGRDGDVVEELLLFPAMDELVIKKCPRLKFQPLPPRGRKLIISDCEQLMLASLWHGEERGVEAPTNGTSALVTELVVERCGTNLCDWSLIHHLPGLQILTIRSYDNLTSSPEIIRALSSSLHSLCFLECEELTSLPEHLSGLASLKILAIQGCPAITCLPESMPRIEQLYVTGSPKLKGWCRSTCVKVQRKAFIASELHDQSSTS